MAKNNSSKAAERGSDVREGDADIPSTAVASRTLITAGFAIAKSRRMRTHIEIYCSRIDLFGRPSKYFIALCDGSEPPATDVRNIRKEADNFGGTLVVVCKDGGQGWLSWREFLDSLGGPVPSWRALGAGYLDALERSSRNSLPIGQIGEAWRTFEEAVADGFEFALGNRVVRLGGRTRGKKVSDLLTQTPDNNVLVLDAKAAANGFDAVWGELRALVEYTTAQITRQKGHYEVRGAVIVSSDFNQSPDQLASQATEFLAVTRVPLTFMRARQLGDLVGHFSASPGLRTSVNWTRLLCRGGLLEDRQILEEIDAATDQTYPRGSPVRTR
jgi:hypothetical protein